jgi:hypothetical protein
MVNKREAVKGVLQERIIWEAEGRSIVKEVMDDKEYRLRMDIRGKLSTGQEKVVIQEYFTEQEKKYLSYLLKLTQDLDREIASYVEDRVNQHRQPDKQLATI